MRLTYGIDVHGTLACRTSSGVVGRSTLFPLLEPLMRAWVEQGEHVYIVSGPTASWVRREVDELGLVQGVHYHGILSMVDFLKSHGEVMREDPPNSGHWWTDDETWNQVKGHMAAEFGINILIDDQPEYEASMPRDTSFVLVQAHLLEPR